MHLFILKYFPVLLLLFSLFLFSQKQEIDSTTAVLKEKLVKKGLRGYYEKDTFILKKANNNLLKLYTKTNDSSILAKHYLFKALFNKIIHNSDSAFQYYHQSKNISTLIKDSLSAGCRLLSIANLQREAKDYLGSEIISIEALHYLEPIKAHEFTVYVYNNLGIVSKELNQNDEAIKYYKKALKTNNLKTDLQKKEEGYLYIINNLGHLYQLQGQHSKAISYFKKGLIYNDIERKYPIQYAFLLENLAFSNFSIGKTKKVLDQYKKVLTIRRQLKEYQELSTTHINLADYYKKFKNQKKAVYHSNEALKYAKQTHNNKRWLEALQNLSELTTGEQSKKYLQEYITLNDSLFQKERLLKNQFAKIRYETDKKEKENTVLKTDNEKKQAEITYQKQQKTIGWLAAASGILLFGLSVMFFFQRRRKLLYQAQLERVQAREHERQQIAKSLHDEVAGDLRLLHQKLEKSNLLEEAKKLDTVKDNVRNLSHQLSSVSFDKVSFKDQIINLVSDYFELDFRITVTGLQEYDWQTINDAIKRLLYLSTRESIQNSKKYAQASKLTIDFALEKKYVHLTITDNGIGFDTNVSKKGIGLQNLQERVEELNGTLDIDSEVGNGTKTNIQIPLNAWTNKNTSS